MTITVQELIDLGVAEEHDADTINFIVKINVRKAVIEAGGLEDFCGMYGWQPTVSVEGEEIPNPVPVHVRARDIIVRFVNDVFRGAVAKKVNEQAELQKQQILSQML